MATITRFRAGMAALALLAGLALAAPLGANGLTDLHDNGATQGAGSDMTPASGEMLESGEWRAVLVGESQLSADDGVTLAFAGGRVAGRSGCNRFTGGYEAGTLAGGDLAALLALGPLAGTRMACPGRGDEVEAQVLPALERVDGFLLDGQGRLLLMSGAEVVLVAVPG